MEIKKSKQNNTVSVDFRGCPIRPSIQEVEKLLKCEMQLDFSQCVAIQMHHVRNCVLITFSGGREIAEEFVKRNNFRHVIVHNTIKYKIPVHVDDGAIEVRVCDLPIYLEQSDVRHQMKAYGEVISARFERWKNYFGGIYSGARIVRMHLQRPIPSYARFEFKTNNGLESFVSRISYPGQVSTCQHCGKEMHLNLTCIEAASRNSTPTPTEQQIKSSQLNEKQTQSSISQQKYKTQPEIKTTIAANSPVTTIIAETVETETPKAKPQEEKMQPPAEQFTVVKTKGKIARKQLTRHENTAGSSEEDISETPDEAGAEVASPPRKKMVTRRSKRQKSV